MPSDRPLEGKCGSPLRGKPGQYCTKNPMEGRERCELHGGKSPRGIAHPSFKTGRYSKSIPSRLAEGYHEVLSDPAKLELDNELAVLVARNREILASLYSGDSDGLRKRMRAEKRAMERARREGDADAAAEHLSNVLRMIERGAADAERWIEWQNNTEHLRRLAESERKRRVEDHQMASVDQVMAFAGALLAAVREEVADRRILARIGTRFDALMGESLAGPSEN